MRGIIFISLVLNTGRSFSQGPGAYVPPKVYEFAVKDCFKNVKYSGKVINDTLRPNNILMGQRIWRTIGLENKQNEGLFSSGNNCSQIGFFEVIKFGLFEKKLNAFFSDNFDDAYKNRVSEAQLMEKISSVDTSEVTSYDAAGNEKKEVVIEKKYLYNKDIKTYLLKEDWVLNNHSGQLEKRIIAIAPLMFEKKTDKVLPLFWLYYNEWKELFGSFEAKNYYGDFRINYRQVLEKKYFISRVSKESNIFERIIKSYKSGTDVDGESDAIKEKVYSSEKDLFEN